ncbi:MAG TPA: potassium channel family protein [Longimicrobiaceae bacterium]|nr:potassium channel family protein [Longimicrobiaceae bacterium]
MSLLCLVAGVLLITLAAIDALWTTLWVDGHGGPLTSRHTSWTRRLIWHLVPRDDHRLLSLTGPAVLVTSVGAWTLLLWTGWTVLFSADPRSLLHSHAGTPAGLVDRVYFVGYSLFTLGNGDFSPRGPGWELATAAASLSGLFLVTLAVTYLLSLLEAVVQKRSFASQVMALGRTPEELVLHAWDGRGFPALELQIVSLTEQLNLVSEQHQAYPMLHYYHEAREEQSVPLGLTIFDDALTLLAHAVREEHRPGPAALHCARESVRLFLDTLRTAYVEPAGEPAPPPDLGRLRAAGIPTVPDGELAATLRGLEERRRLLRGFLEGENRAWPGAR